MSFLTILGGGGGVIAVIGAVIVIGRGIFRQVSATEALSDAVRTLTVEVAKLQGMLNNHETRITVLEDRIKR